MKNPEMLEILVDDLFKLEREGRRLAYEYKLVPVGRLISWSKKVKEDFMALYDVATDCDCMPNDFKTLFKEIYNISSHLVTTLETYLQSGVISNRESIEDAWTKIRNLPAEDNRTEEQVVYREMESICKNARDAFGKQICFLTREDYEKSFGAVLNDITTIIHNVALWLTKAPVFKKEYTKINELVTSVITGKGQPTREIVSFANYWYDAVKLYSKLHLYVKNDVEALKGDIYDPHTIMLSVGSSPGHTTNVTINTRSIEINYFDTDNDVNDIMSKLFAKLGYDLIRYTANEGFIVKYSGPISDKILKKSAYTLALATSMDYRVDNIADVLEPMAIGDTSIARRLLVEYSARYCALCTGFGIQGPPVNCDELFRMIRETINHMSPDQVYEQLDKLSVKVALELHEAILKKVVGDPSDPPSVDWGKIIIIGLALLGVLYMLSRRRTY